MSDKKLDTMRSPTLPKLMYTVDEVLHILGIKKTKFYGLVKEGRLSITKIGRKSLVKSTTLFVFVDSLKEGC